MISPNTAAVQEEQQPRFLLKELIFLNIITRASVKERIHVEQYKKAYGVAIERGWENSLFDCCENEEEEI